MKKILPFVLLGLVLIVGLIVWQKSQVKPQQPAAQNQAGDFEIKKVDLTTQPEWVRKLQVTAKRGWSANGLENVTLKISGLPKRIIEKLSYTIQYQTSNKGIQGALSTTPVSVSGAAEYTKTIDFGTCSTKSCVRHDGVAEIEAELEFTTSSGEQAAWSGTIGL